MVKMRGSSKGKLQGQLEHRLKELVYRLLDEKTDMKQKFNPNSEEALAKDLKFNEVLAYVQQKDLSLQREKKFVLEKTVERVISNVLKEQRLELESLGGHIDDQVDEDFESIDVDELMEVPDQNLLNKSVVQLWNVKPKKDETTEADKDADEEIQKKEIKKSKKRSKESSKSSKKQKISEDRSPPETSLSELGGMDDVIDQLMELVGLPILHPEIYKELGSEPSRGILLHGPPGCGKTTIANALAGELQVPFLNISAPSVVSGMSGESEKMIRELFDEAKSLAPCIVFFDEIDAITPKRESAQREMEKRIVAQMLTCIDEVSFSKTDFKPVILLGATNRPDALDPALRRGGRFDKEICLKIPSEVSRAHILEKMASNIKIHDGMDFLQLAKMTPGFVGADLKDLISAATKCAVERIFDSSTLKEEGSNKESEESSTIRKFLKENPDTLRAEQLANISITYDDFLKALPTIQPMAKREGFAAVPDVTWDNVGALSNIRGELDISIVQPIKNPKLYEEYGLDTPTGILMWGPPGCGKTLLAKAVANESKANFISVKGSELMNKYVGESEKAVRQVFTRARDSVPCVIFFDELDGLVPKRGDSLSESSSRVVNTFLTELDGVDDRKGIFVIGATNRPDDIDPAMLRPGRFDKKLFIGLPTPADRFEILKTVVKIKRAPLDPDIDLESIAASEKLNNFSGADLSALVQEAGVNAMKRRLLDQDTMMDDSDTNHVSKRSILPDDFEAALKKIQPSVKDKDRIKYEKMSNAMNAV